MTKHAQMKNFAGHLLALTKAPRIHICHTAYFCTKASQSTMCLKKCTNFETI